MELWKIIFLSKWLIICRFQVKYVMLIFQGVPVSVSSTWLKGDDWSSSASYSLCSSYFLLPSAAEEDIEGFLTFSIYIPENQHVPYKRDEDSKGKDRFQGTCELLEE